MPVSWLFGLSTPRAAYKNSDPGHLVMAISQVARESMPAVVHIEVTEREEVSDLFVPLEDEPFFRYFSGLTTYIPQHCPGELE